MPGRCAAMLKSRFISVFFVLAGFATVAALSPVAALAAPPPPSAEPEAPQLVFEPGSYDFGLQQVNSGSDQANLQLRNVGSEPAQVNSLELTGPGTEAFWFNSNCFGMNLQPNETCSVQMNFSPHEMREYAAQLRADSGPYSFTANLTGEGGRAIFEPGFNPTDFGVAAVGSPGTTREITLSNTGNLPGGVFIAVIAGGAVGSFQLLDENCTGHPLAPRATCTLQVRFRPLSEGVKTATLGLFGEQEGGTQVILTGVGTAPAPPPAPASTVSPSAAAADVVASSTALHRHKPRPPGQRVRRRHRRAAVHESRLVDRPH
jgi:hypothetical protein